MGKKARKPTFEAWITYIFDHPVKKPAWHFGEDRQFYDEMAYPQQTVEYLLKLFESPTEHTQRFSDAQINQGLNMLISPSASNYMFTLFDSRVVLEIRKQTVKAMLNVFEQLFLPLCSAHLSHLIRSKSDKPDVNPLNSVCYMWWDIIPFYGKSGDPEREVFDKLCLKVMKSTLQLNSIACQESALHGLGHWKHTHPERVQHIIDTFLSQSPYISEPLRTYALDARRGYVL